MSNPGDADATPITSVSQLADHIAAGCKPKAAWRIGTEHEKFGFRRADLAPPAYEPGGIRALLEGMQGPDWSPIFDRDNPIGLTGEGPIHDGASVSLEPAGQLELSGGPVETLHDTSTELKAHFAHVAKVAGPLGLGFIPLGFHPTMTRDQMPWMPKGRYAIMRRYMPLVGTRGLDMMTRTCTVQVNLDYASEADMVRKLRVALLLQPLATAMFANSPFTEGRLNGLQSARAEVWTDVDNARSGIPAVFFEPGFGFERYVEWLLDLPMYFVHRQDLKYIDLAGQSFREFMHGRLTHPGVGVATVGDFADHMTTAFTDVRLKRFLEMRGADAGTPEMMVAQSALWVGLLYDDAAFAAVESLVAGTSKEEFLALRAVVPRLGLSARWGSGTLRDLAREVVAIAQDGLRSRARLDPDGNDETVHLFALEALAAGGPSQSDTWIDLYNGDWNRDITRIFRYAVC